MGLLHSNLCVYICSVLASYPGRSNGPGMRLVQYMYLYYEVSNWWLVGLYSCPRSSLIVSSQTTEEEPGNKAKDLSVAGAGCYLGGRVEGSCSRSFLSLLLCRHVIDLPLPRVELRKRLWQKLVPKRAPMAADIDFKGLGERYQHHPQL